MAINWVEIQNKWQKQWSDAELGKAKVDKTKSKFMMIFAYPGISGFLHVGHMRGFSYTDAICRLERMRGKQVLFPLGTHASGNHAFAFANKVKNKDEKWTKYLLDNGCSEEKLKELEDPYKIIEYFNEVYVNDYWKKFGFLADWERFTSTVNKDYEKFIQWQFTKLNKKGLLTQKPYFATACVVDGPVAVDPSETDISKGGTAEKNEYTLIKFKFDDNTYLVAATLRPETMYGQTNLWVNPDTTYIKVEVDNEIWIMSTQAAEKLSYQKDDILPKEEISGKSLIGKTVLAPVIEREIPILPAAFVNENVGSGIVTCVPSDAPYDYVALRTLKEDENAREELSALGLNLSIVDDIKLISIIKSKGFGEFPAKEIADKLGIKSLEDKEKLEEATKEMYKVGFHSGELKENCGKYASMKVSIAKEQMKLDLIELGKADVFHDLSEEVICRCGEKVIIKRIDDQWFIRYSDADLTERSKDHVEDMYCYPNEYKQHLPGILDWFNDRACARLGKWMGSEFPLDKKWTIEPISDSTLYPVYYIVSGFVKRGELDVEDLTEEFFDYVYLSEGREALKSNVSSEKFSIMQKVREEFEYFYPLDMNLGGKEHKTVHFPVFLMNHVAILPEDKWPRSIFLNWWVTGKGGKISKSKGGAEPIPNAMEKYGVDAMRLYYAHIGSPHVDVVWDESVVSHYKNSLEKIETLCNNLCSLGEDDSIIDAWIISEFHKSLHKINKALESYNLRELASETYFTIPDTFRWYLRRGGNNRSVIKELMTKWFRLMNPISPHLSEELAEQFDCRGDYDFVSIAPFPKADEIKISKTAGAGEKFVRGTMDGMRSVIKLAKIDNPNKFTLFIAKDSIYDLIRVIKKEIEVTRNMGEIIKKVLSEPSIIVKGKDISKLIGSFLKDPSRIPEVVTSQQVEFELLLSAKEFLEKEFDAEVEIIKSEDSENPKAKSAMPGKVGLMLE